MNINVDFQPTKVLFIDVLTKDISVLDCILDLIDNSVDAYIRNKINDKRKVEIEISKKRFSIYDTCGGISKDDVEKQIFKFGAPPKKKNLSTIGFYGVGLKRAMFKLGKKIIFETDDKKNKSELTIKVPEWLKKPDNDWILEGTSSESSLKKSEKPYTKITIDNFRKEALETFTSTFEEKLKTTISRYYTMFSQKNQIEFFLNDKEPIQSLKLNISISKELKPAIRTYSQDGVNVKIQTWIEPSTDARSGGHQGWNIFMNNRLILMDESSEKTGWTGERKELPKMHPIYNQFRGNVFLDSKDPSKLPINTMKNDFNFENPIYVELKRKLCETARPLIDYLSKKYEKVDEKESQTIATILKQEAYKGLKEIDATTLNRSQKFKAPQIKKIDNMVTISYKKPIIIVEKVKEHLSLKNKNEAGSLTFDYFVQNEELQNGK